ncbi:MAG: ribonuclease PH [Planctomycetota bacterium]
MRNDGRQPDELRNIKITRKYTEAPDGSVLVEFGKTKVICTALVEETVPPFLFNSGQGWVTSEYAMLPGASPQRKQRESRRGKADGRSLEIGRLAGRCLRAITEMKLLGQRTIWVDCDVLQADGGTRTAAITGGFVALHDAVKALSKRTELKGWPLKSNVAAISVGLINDEPILDLNYEEDSRASVDMNIIMTAAGEYVEIQGGAERNTFTDTQLEAMLSLGRKGISDLIVLQNEALGVVL